MYLRRQQLLERAKAVVLPVLANLGYELVELDMVVSHGRRTLRVFIHRKGGVTLDGCATVSKAIGPALDEESLVPQRYYLEVSSPGAERKLRTRDDFRIFVGSKVRIRTTTPDGEQGNIEGFMEGFSDDVVTVRQVDGTCATIRLEEISGARLSL
jgi:ribosome maturation factor RimP